MAEKAKTKEQSEQEQEELKAAAAQQQETPLDVHEPEAEVPDHEKRRLWRAKLHDEVEGNVPEEDKRFELDPSVHPHSVVVRDTLIGLQVQYKTLAHTVIDQVGFEEGLGQGALQALEDSLNKAVEDVVTNQRPDMYNN